MNKTTLISLFVITALFSGCEDNHQPSSAQIEMRQNEVAQQRLMNSVPTPVVKTSLERKNLAKRIERVNQENMVSYIYLISYGKVMAYYTISGKVSSMNSYLTAMERIVRVNPQTGKIYGNDESSQLSTIQVLTSEAPDLDGTYGKNVEGIFFFTTEGVYVEWRGEYLWSDQPLKITQPPELVKEIK